MTFHQIFDGFYFGFKGIGGTIIGWCVRIINFKFHCSILNVASWNRYCSCGIVETWAKHKKDK